MEIPTPGGGHLWAESVGDGEPVVLLSGMSQDHRAWAAQMPLAEQFRLILPDNRGTGQSSDFEGTDIEPTTGMMADDVIRVLDGLGIEKAHLVGHSMGGRIAQWVAIRFPRRVGTLTLCSTSPGERHGVARTDDADRKLARADPLELALLNYTPRWLGAHSSLVAQINASTSERSQQRAFHLEATHGHDSWSSLSRIKAPTLIVHGTDDEINPARNAELLAEQIPDADLLIIPSGRHNVAAEYADQVNAAMTDFIHAHPLES